MLPALLDLADRIEARDQAVAAYVNLRHAEVHGGPLRLWSDRLPWTPWPTPATMSARSLSPWSPSMSGIELPLAPSYALRSKALEQGRTWYLQAVGAAEPPTLAVVVFEPHDQPTPLHDVQAWLRAHGYQRIDPHIGIYERA
jgi:hypothetical protein